MNEINKEEYSMNIFTSLMWMLSIWGSWIRTDYGTIEDSGIKSYMGTRWEIMYEILDVPKYRARAFTFGIECDKIAI